MPIKIDAVYQHRYLNLVNAVIKQLHIPETINRLVPHEGHEHFRLNEGFSSLSTTLLFLVFLYPNSVKKMCSPKVAHIERDRHISRKTGLQILKSYLSLIKKI